MTAEQKYSKAIAIAESVTETATGIVRELKKLPKGKHKRNVFIKTYNRRPGNKRKRAIVMMNSSMSAMMGAMQVAMIMQTPIPKLKPGGIAI